MSGPPMDVPRSEAVGAGGTGRRRLKRAAPGQPERGPGTSRSPCQVGGGQDGTERPSRRLSTETPRTQAPASRARRVRRLRGGRESEPRSLVSRNVAVKKKKKKRLSGMMIF